MSITAYKWGVGTDAKSWAFWGWIEITEAVNRVGVVLRELTLAQASLSGITLTRTQLDSWSVVQPRLTTITIFD